MEKTMRKLVLVLIATLSVCLTSCSDDEKDGPNSIHPLKGYWVFHDEDDPFAYQFNADGSGTAQSLPYGRLDEFTDYKVEGKHLYIMWDGDDEYDDEGLIRVNSNTFELNSDGEWQTFTRE